MILSGREILKHIGNEIVIEPFDKRRINPNSYNLSLFNELLVYENNILDMRQPNRTSKIVIPDVEICQIYYHDIAGEYDLYCNGKYQNNTGIQPSLMYKDFENESSL